MLATRTAEEFIFVDNKDGVRVGTYSTRCTMHMDALKAAIGNNAMALLLANVGKTVDLKTLEVKDYLQ